MDNQRNERWLELAEAASKEQDPKKLLALVKRLNHALDERQRELLEQHNKGKSEAN